MGKSGRLALLDPVRTCCADPAVDGQSPTVILLSVCCKSVNVVFLRKGISEQYGIWRAATDGVVAWPITDRSGQLLSDSDIPVVGMSTRVHNTPDQTVIHALGIKSEEPCVYLGFQLLPQGHTLVVWAALPK